MATWDWKGKGIEVLANLKGNSGLFPDSYQLMKITLAEHAATGALELDGLIGNWRADMNQTKSIGDCWLAGGNSALLAVPSVPSPESMNYLLSPLHPDAKGAEIEWCKWINYDKRLFHILRRNDEPFNRSMGSSFQTASWSASAL